MKVAECLPGGELIQEWIGLGSQGISKVWRLKGNPKIPGSISCTIPPFPLGATYYSQILKNEEEVKGDRRQLCKKYIKKKMFIRC